ncbi:MAG: aminotransferase class I/II-fold pyridoxal phosphate-dependent enzyme [Deltaproteobacteria bacterium]|nr:aminotransferase class I/II-fold pyridoxal phosphate-dependent enzyme [Candidatus Zymogenaceae bacterium]
MIDLRSDTITRPTEPMRRAMYEAQVGDDVFFEDPTVNRLQERVAALLGKERALWVASGTMGNLLSIKALTQPGEEVILETENHIFVYEAAGSAVVSGVQLSPIQGKRGLITRPQVEAAIRPADIHQPRTSVVVIENTHNRAGGAVIPLGEIERISELCQQRGISMHMDGARLLNAVVASGIEARRYAQHFDTVTICFSKGLGVPMGSMIAGSGAVMDRVHRFRKMIGGGQRQVGIVAAAALYALDHHVERLAEDHANAKRLAEALSMLPDVSVNPEEVDTNIVIFQVDPARMSPTDVVVEMQKRAVLMFPFGPTNVRCVTHLDVSSDDIEAAIGAFSEVFKKGR